MTTPVITINGRTIGPGHPVYVIAEMSANHHQDLEAAIKIVHAAHEAGADAIKLQTYTPDTMTIESKEDPFVVKGLIWEGRTLYDLYGEAYTPWEWQPKLKEIANKLGMDCFSTPFDPSSVEFLEKMDVPAYKIASFENVDLPLLRQVARTGKPIIMSTGMASLAEISEAVETLRGAGACDLALLKCTSAYPAPAEEANLRTIPHLAEAFGTVVGLSDHTLGTTAPVVATAMGASIIEKHFTLSREVPGPDSTFSLEPHEFRAMVDAVRFAEKSLGNVQYTLTPRESKSRPFRRSLFVVEDVRAGEPFTSKNVRSIRPADGLHTRHLGDVLGRNATRDIRRGTPLKWELVGGLGG